MYFVRFSNQAMTGGISVTCRFSSLKSAYQFFSTFQKTVNVQKTDNTICCFAFLASAVTDRILLWWDIGDDFTDTKSYITLPFSVCFPEYRKEN